MVEIFWANKSQRWPGVDWSKTRWGVNMSLTQRIISQRQTLRIIKYLADPGGPFALHAANDISPTELAVSQPLHAGLEETQRPRPQLTERVLTFWKWLKKCELFFSSTSPAVLTVPSRPIAAIWQKWISPSLETKVKLGLLCLLRDSFPARRLSDPSVASETLNQCFCLKLDEWTWPSNCMWNLALERKGSKPSENSAFRTFWNVREKMLTPVFQREFSSKQISSNLWEVKTINKSGYFYATKRLLSLF